MDEQKIVCERCGLTRFIAPDKRKRKDNLCSSCRARPAKTINYGLEKSCKPWSGTFDQEDNPTIAGHLYMPGPRLCGHRDCVEPSHCH